MKITNFWQNLWQIYIAAVVFTNFAECGIYTKHENLAKPKFSQQTEFIVRSTNLSGKKS